MSLFKIEIFDRDFNFRSAAAVESPELMMDYLTLESTTIHLPRTDAKRGDWAHITDYNGKVVYQGIIKDVSAGSSSTALKIAPLLSLFDVQVQYDHRIFTQPLENCIRQIIIDTYIGNPDRLQNIPGLKIKQLTQTKGSSLDIRSDIHAFWDIITKGITMYDIIVDCVMDPQRKELMVTIGKRSGEVTLEADRDNCLGSNFVLTDDYGSLNKVTFKNKDNEDEVLTYYLHPDGKIDTKNENRIVPVFFSAEYIQGADNFESEAKSRAKEQLAPQKYQQIIELSFRENDRMIEPDTLDVGVTAMIHHNGKAYRSILTGWKSEGGIKTLMFGCLRLELTKKLILERRRYGS